MTIECSNFSKCGNNTGNWLDPDRNQISVIFCSQECSIAILENLVKENPPVVYAPDMLVTPDRQLISKYHELMPTHRMLYDMMISLDVIKIESTPSVGVVFTYVDGSTLKVINDE